MNPRRRVLATPIGQLETAAGRITLSTTGDAVHLIVVRGHLEEAHARYWIERIDPTLDRGDAEAFCDWELMTGYDSNARKLLTEWAVRRRERSRYACFLVRPGIVAMGVSVASMVLSTAGLPTFSTTDRERFEQLYAERASRRPSMFPPRQG